MVSQEEILKQQIRQAQINKAISEGTTWEAGQVTGFSSRQAIRGLSKIGIRNPSERTKLIRQYITRAEEHDPSKLPQKQQELLLLKQQRIAEARGIPAEQLQSTREGIVRTQPERFKPTYIRGEFTRPETRTSIGKETITTPTYTEPTTKIHPPGTIYQVQTGRFKVPGKDKYIPVTETYTVGKDFGTREATAEERESLREYQQAESFQETALKEKPSRIGFEVSELYGKYKDLSSEEIISKETIQNIIAKDTGEGKYQQQVNQFLGGAVYSTVGTKGALIRTGAIVGATAGVGFIIQGVTAGATAGATALWGARAGAITRTTFKLGIYGTGAYFGGQYVSETSQQIYEAPTAWEKGEITGRGVADIGASVYGFGVGQRAFTKVDPFTKVTRIEAVRKVMTPEFKEVSYSVIKGGKEIKLAQYKIFGERRPPMIRTETTAFRETFKISPKKVTPIPAKTFSIETLSPAIYQKPFYVSEVTAGSRVSRIKRIEGYSYDINVRTGELPKLDKYLLQRYAEDIIGRPLSAKDVSKFFKRESDFGRSYISSERIVDIKITGKKTADIISPKETGRLTTYDLGITRTKPFLETDYVRVFTSETYFKDISQPFPRASGKTPKLKGTIYQIKEPFILDKVSDVKFIKKADITKTPWSTTFGEQAQILQRDQLLKAVLPKPSKIPIPTETKVVQFTPTSIYAGLGLYERTESVEGYTPISVSGTRGDISTVSILSPSLIHKDIPTMREVTLLGQAPMLKEMTKVKDIQKIKQEPALKEVTKLKLLPKIKVIEKLKQTQKIKQVQKLKQLQKLKTITTPTSIIPTIPTKKPPVIIPPFPKGRGFPKQPPQKFTVFGRRFGKFKAIGTARTERKAFALGKKFAGTTLGATFKIPKSKVFKLPGFRTKKEKGSILFIEPRKRRLKKRGAEVKEIQLFKKVSKRRAKK